MTSDEQEFGSRVYVYCNQHLNPHLTGWCTVGNHNKIKLDATTAIEAGKECRQKGYPLYSDVLNEENKQNESN